MKWLKKLKDIVDPNHWAERIGNKQDYTIKQKNHLFVNGH